MDRDKLIIKILSLDGVRYVDYFDSEYIVSFSIEIPPDEPSVVDDIQDLISSYYNRAIVDTEWIDNDEFAFKVITY